MASLIGRSRSAIHARTRSTARENSGRPPRADCRRRAVRRPLLPALRQRREHLRDPAAGGGASALDGRRGRLRAVRGRKTHFACTPAAPAAAWPANRSGRGWWSTSPSTCGGSSASMRESVRVQPGMVHERLNAHLRPRGRIFGPDPANTAVTTIGSMIAIDASGSRWLKYGSVRRHVESLQVVLADGQVLEFGREPLVAGASIDSNPRKRELINRLSAILAASTEVIRSQQPSSPLNRCGYNLADVLGENSIDLAGVMVGSEGTLGLITEATLATQSLPRHRGVVLLLFESLDKAARSRAVDPAVASGRLRPDGPPPPEPGAGERSPLRSADSRRGRSGPAGRVRGRRAAGNPRPDAGFDRRRAAAGPAGLRQPPGLRPGRDRVVLATCRIGPCRCCIG